MQTLENRIGYGFSDPSLLRLALTHPGAGKGRRDREGDNQRLEFLGDSVLQLVLTDWLFHEESRMTEGRMTALRASLAAKPSLVRVASALGLREHLVADKPLLDGPAAGLESALADAFEAVLGAIYLDGGLESAAAFVRREFAGAMAAAERAPDAANPKGALQETLQAMDAEQPLYEVIADSGPDHARSFEVVVTWRGHELGCGEGPSKKAAEIAAARDALAQRLWEKMG